MTDVVEAPGPWEHRTVAARGARFHFAEVGDGPLVLFLHGFPEFWWAWRDQLPEFAERGCRAVALDLRGVGGSDHTPRGYDLPSLTEDVVAVVRSLGATAATVVGHGWGGLVGWTLAATHPEVVDRLVVIGAAHPLRLRAAVLTRPRQIRAVGYAWRMQAPWLPERRLVRDDGAYVARMLRAWGGPGWPTDDVAARYRAAMQLGNTAYCTAEYHRWAMRSVLRPDGLRFARRVGRPIDRRVLQIHGELDRCVLPATAAGSGRYVVAPYRMHTMPDVGHFPHEEAPQQLNDVVLSWLAEPEAVSV